MHAASLNHTFRLVWSDTLGSFIAVAETTKGRGKKSRSGRALGALRAVALAGLSLTGGVSWADTFVTTVEAGGVQQSQSEWTTVGMETFNSKTSSSSLNFSTSFGGQVGAFPLINGFSATVAGAGIFSGVSNGVSFGEGLTYGGDGGTGAYLKTMGTSTITFTTPVNYFGLYISALSGDTVNIYNNTSLLYSLTATSLSTLTGAYSESNLYYGNPNIPTTNPARAATEVFAFVNFYDTTGTFNKVELVGGGFESDNWTLGTYTKISGLNPSAPNIVSAGNAGTNVVSGLGATVNPKFDGGTLKSSTAGTANNDFSITANGGAIDANGTALVFSGVISNDSGATGAMTIKNTGVGGAITFSGVNTYTGATTVDAGGTLKLSGTGSIATSSGVSNAGTFDIQGTTAGANIKSMTGAGGTTLGSKTLTLTTAAGTYSGVIAGTGGGLTVSGGTQTLTGINTYTGTTSISSGATVALSGNGSIEGSSGLTNNGTFSISAKSNGVSIAGISGSGATTLGGNSLTFTNASGTYSGVMASTGGGLTVSGGAQTLSGINTYTGATSISSGATVALSGSGSIATSSGIANSGTFSIAGTTSGASAVNMTGTGATTLGSKTLTLTTAAGTYSGVMAGTGGSLTVSGGAQTLTGINTYTGATRISSGATVTLSGSGAIAASSGLANSGTFNIAGTTSGASVVSMTGAGATTLGSKTLTLTTAAGTYSGVMTGTGGALTVAGGSQTLTNINTYTGATSISSGATLAFSGSGSIEASSGLVNNGTFDFAANTSSVAVGRMTGAGTTILGSNGLYINNASGDYGGSINGTGTVFISNGTQIFSGANTHSGGTNVSAGANLQITSAAALGTGVLDLVGSATTSATLSTTADMTLNNVIRVNLDPTFNVASGTTLTLTAPIQDAGDNPGEIVATGGGTLLLTAANTYSGNTTIDAGSTLALSGNGSIALSGTALVPLANGVFNNGTFKISGTTASTVSLGKNYTQSSTGNLLMNWNQKLVVPNSASLGGGLKLTNTNSATYVIGRYTLLQATSVSGTFAAFDTSGLSSGYKYQLAYDASNVYLDLLAGGPSTTATQQSLEGTGSDLKRTFGLQNTYLANGLGYDCNKFGEKSVCFSGGSGQVTSIRAQDNSNVSGQIIIAYKNSSGVRVGAYLDQNFSIQTVGAVKLENYKPAFGLFAAWDEYSDGRGFEFKASVGKISKNATVTRAVVDDSEAGSGSANIHSHGAQAMAKYGYEAAKDMLLSPYAGVRYSQLNMGGYTESTSAGVVAPLAYQAIDTRTTTALIGFGTAFKLNPQTMIYAGAGLEKDMRTKNGTYSASSSAISGLTAIDLNANSQKVRRTASLAAYYDLGSHQKIGVSGVYRQDVYRAAPSTSVFVSYTVGL